MVVAKSDIAHRRLGALLAARKIRRAYATLAWGHLDGERVVEANILRHPADRKRRLNRPDGRTARTDVFPIARLGPRDLLRLEMHCGCTHQFRVHLYSMGHRLVGDPVYGGGGSRRVSGPEQREARRLERLAPRQALHAAVLAFRHPVSGEPLRFQSPWPADLQPLRLGAQEVETLAEPAVSLAALGFESRDS
jgi:23S rRNA pseudouridine1911/1915/1917 synthase